MVTANIDIHSNTDGLQRQCDSLIFDMDGTLWDAVDSYTQIWDKTIAEYGGQREPVSRHELISLMGRHLEDITAILMPQYKEDKTFLELLDHNERQMMPVLGGHLYDGVKEGLARLAESHRLFMVSNCGSYGLDNFLNVTGLRPFFTDSLSHGQTLLPKHDNIRLLVEKHHLKCPYYVGDTQTDGIAARRAGVGIVWCSYGFGTVEEPDFTISTFSELLNLPITQVDTHTKTGL